MVDVRTEEGSRVYERELPGGGFVAIEVADLPQQQRCSGRISVERRVERDRREGHRPPVIATVEGDSTRSVFDDLYRIAADNVAVARAILAWQSSGRPTDVSESGP